MGNPEPVKSSVSDQAQAASARKPSALRRPNGIAEDGSRWLWPFQLTERLGEGGMGVVYRARYVVNDREVAVKMLPDDVQDPVILARFEREMEILKDLKHPNIVRCFGGVCENENRFYAMELVEGGSLEDDIKNRGRLPWEQVVEYAEQMVAALQASHEKGIVHRDVKPGNFLKTKSGRLKLSDFGLARIDAGRKITRAGKTAGTVLYMAPEQIRGQDITPSADLYALGCVLFEMLTGKVPFSGDAAATVLHAHVSSAPPRLGQLAPDCPAVLEELVHQLLEKLPEERPASAAEVGSRLAGIADSINVARSASSYGRTVSSRPITSRSVVSPSDQTQELDKRTVMVRDLLVNSKSPGWTTAALAVAGIVLLMGLMWQASSASSLRPWKARWMELASTPGPNQSLALSTVAELAPTDDEVVDLFVDMLNSDNADSRAAAADAAAKLDTGDMKLIGALNRLAKKDEDDGVRYAAKRAVTLLQQKR